MKWTARTKPSHHRRVESRHRGTSSVRVRTASSSCRLWNGLFATEEYTLEGVATASGRRNRSVIESFVTKTGKAVRKRLPQNPRRSLHQCYNNALLESMRRIQKQDEGRRCSIGCRGGNLNAYLTYTMTCSGLLCSADLLCSALHSSGRWKVWLAYAGNRNKNFHPGCRRQPMPPPTSLPRGSDVLKATNDTSILGVGAFRSTMLRSAFLSAARIPLNNASLQGTSLVHKGTLFGPVI